METRRKSPTLCPGIRRKKCVRKDRVKYVGDGRYCASCQKAEATRKRASARSHGKRIGELYGLTSAGYDAILEAQGGVCYICHRPPGRVRLSVDHDHELEKLGYAPRDCVRGLLDKGCNYRILGWLKDDPEALQRAIDYLADPPARKVLR